METIEIPKREGHQELSQANVYQQRLDTVLLLSRKFIQAECEEEIISLLLEQTIRHSQALGASYVPLDERGIPLSAISQGLQFSGPQISDWVEYLASPTVHGRCKTCNQNHPRDETCPLLAKHPFTETFNLTCLHIRKGENRFGVLNLYIPKTGSMEDETHNFLQILTNETALAIDGLRLREKERQKLRQLKANMQQRDQTTQNWAEIEINAILQERTRLAREFHDGLAQVLGYIKLQLSQIQGLLVQGNISKVEEIIQQSYQTVSEAYVDTREAIDDLHLNTIEKNFFEWLQQVITNFENQNKIPIKISNLPEKLALSPEIQLQLTRIIQEALSNIRKHAGASEICLHICSEESGLLLEIRDNGQGFSSADIFEPSQHGLKSMQERAALISADFEVISQPDQGTIVRLHLSSKTLENHP